MKYLTLMTTISISWGCASLPKEGSKPEYTSKTDYHSRQYKNFDVSKYTNAPLRITKVFQLNIPKEQAFDVLSFKIPTWFTDIPEVSYFSAYGDKITLANHSVKAGNVRVCKFKDDILVESIPGYKKGEFIAYQIDVENSTVGFPIENHLAIMTVEGNGNGGSVVVWRQYFDKRFHILAPMVTFAISSIMDDGLEELTSQHGGQMLTTRDLK